MNIDGVGPSLIDQLLDADLLSDVSDFFTLTHEDISSLDRMGSVSVQNLFDSLDHVRENTELPNFLFSLGIPLLGEQAAQLLSKNFFATKPEVHIVQKEIHHTGEQESLFDIPVSSQPEVEYESHNYIQPIAVFSFFARYTEDDYLSIDGIGQKLADTLVAYFSSGVHKHTWEKLQQAGLLCLYQEINLHPEFEGKTFVFTGTLQHYSREQAKKLVIDNGGSIGASVSKSIDVVVIGSEAGSKKEKAQTL